MYYTADVIKVTDYYPFGWGMPGRRYNQGDYRYGFNTQEKVDEVKGSGNHYTAEFWEYDPRAVHRWNLDPKAHPGFSPYDIMRGNPILFSDQNGDTVRVEGSRREKRKFRKLLQKRTGNKYGYDKEGNLFRKNKNLNESTDSEKSGTLSKLVDAGIGVLDVIPINLGTDDEIPFDSYATGLLDIGDFKNTPPEIQAGMLAHVFLERMATPGGYQNPNNRTQENYDNIGHPAGVMVESRVVSEMTNRPFAIRSGLTFDGPNESVIFDEDRKEYVTHISSFNFIMKYGQQKYKVIVGVKRTPIGNGESQVDYNKGKILRILRDD